MGKGFFLGDVKWSWGKREGVVICFGSHVYPTIPALPSMSSLLSWARRLETGPAVAQGRPVPAGNNKAGADETIFTF